MATTKTYVLTTGFDQIVTGQELILNGVDQAKHVPTGKHKTIVLNANNPGSFNSGDDIEITNLATNNTLNASYLNFNTEVVATLLGVQLINVKIGEHDVTWEGGNVATFGGGSAANYNGLANGTFTLLQSTGGEFFLGGGAPLEVLATNFVAQNATPEGSGLDVNLDAALFTSPVTVKAAFNGVGNPGTHQFVSDDYVHGGSNAFEFAYGSSDGTVTATTWSLTTTGKSFVALFTHGATTPTEVDVKGAGSMTLFGESFEFANVKIVNDTATGAQVITGALQTDGSSRPDLGFLTDNTALTSLTVSSTNAGNFVDLSGFESLTGIAISVGGGTVVLDDDVLLNLSAPLVLGNPTNIGYGGDEGNGPGDEGTINWNFLPSSAHTLTFYHGVDASGTLSILNTPNTFTMNLQDENFHHNNFVITAATPALSNTLTLDLGNAVTGGTPNDINENWAVNGYGTVNIVLAGADDVHLGSELGFFVNPGAPGGATINITGALLDGTEVEEMHFGNVTDIGNLFDVYKAFNSIAATAGFGVVTHDGTINDTAKVFLELGVTDASLVDATKGNGLDLQDPGTDIDGTFVINGSSNNFNLLQGTLGLVTGDNGDKAIEGFAGPATITGGTVADHIFDTGGTETIFVNNLHTKVFADQFVINSDHGPNGEHRAFEITDDNGNFTNNLGAGPMAATINGFTPGFNDGTNTSWVDFDTASWADPGGAYKSLVDGSANEVSNSSHFASVSIITGTNNDFAAGTDLVAYQLGGPYAGASAVAAALASNGGAIDFSGTLVAGDTYDILVAYAKTGGGTGIMDYHFVANDTHLSTSTNFSGHQLVNLTGVALTQVESSLLGSNDVVHFNGA